MNTSRVHGSLLHLASRSLLAAVVPVMVGCGPLDEDHDQVGAEASEINARYGADYAWARPTPARLKAAGYSFVVRYLSYDNTGKNLTANEAQTLRQAGIDVVSNWEWTENDALGGYWGGVEYAKAADRQAAAAGMPAGRPIYFSVDFDASASQQGIISAYFDGVASVIGKARTGAYGSYSVIKRLFDAGKITWGWQTYAWSGGNWDPRAQLRQIQNGLDGGQLDKNQAMAADFGQWGAGMQRTTCAGFKGSSEGAIGEKYRALGGCGSTLGGPLTSELTTRDGVGRYNHFERGSIYWTPRTGAQAVIGPLRDKWKQLGWEDSILGYPTTDELTTADGVGRYNVFQHGSIYWKPEIGAHEVHGMIRQAWKEAKWEMGSLGYPTSDEIAIPGGAKSTFEGGEITWDAKTNTTTVKLYQN